MISPEFCEMACDSLPIFSRFARDADASPRYVLYIPSSAKLKDYLEKIRPIYQRKAVSLPVTRGARIACHLLYPLTAAAQAVPFAITCRAQCLSFVTHPCTAGYTHWVPDDVGVS